MNCFKSRRRGFTLIELLIVTVVIVTLMGIVFRLAGVGGDSRAKSKTQARLQRLENAVSGYYAAYGSYPPVPLQGRSQDINVKVDGLGVQGSVSDTRNVSLTSPNAEDKKQIEAACRAQPIGVVFPFYMIEGSNSEKKNNAQELVTALASESRQSFTYLNNVGSLRLGREDEATLFQFGLLSFLLPRYLFMLEGAPAMYDTRHSQWDKNNQLPCRIDTGRPYESWEDMQRKIYKGMSSNAKKESFLIQNLASQSVCARWMPNLEGIISGGLEFYGVDTGDHEAPYLMGTVYTAAPNVYHGWLRTFSRGGYNNESSRYLLNGMTVADGWGHEFYYYSAPPFQSYQLWSAGANGHTFPPWLMENLDSYSPKEQSTITGWTNDDIKHLAN